MQTLAVGNKGSALKSVAGFTLIEMLVVLTIVALMMAVVVPAINRGMSVTANDVARDVQIGLRKARADAVTQQKSQAFVVDTQNREFQIRGRKTTRLSEGIELTAKVAQSEAMDGKAAVRFYPDGSSTGGRIGVHQDDEQILINIDWLTGRVSLVQEQ
jgi:general secretion pathway protein H